MTGDLGWDEKQRVYSITEETKRFAGIVGSPAARDLSVMPYQEEPRDVPIRFAVDVSPEAMDSEYIPIVIAGGVAGRDEAKATYDRLLRSARDLYEKNVAHYRSLQERTVSLTTPDDRLDTAFAWAKVGVDKGLATNPTLGTGLLAGFRTSGQSERPGFAWMFGRDALWTALAIHSYGDFPAARTALEFLRKFQRADGKIPHEISQSAGLIPWFTDYKYPWESADATPLYVIAQADHWRATGDLAFLRGSWPSIVKAWRFSAATDTDGNGLIENTRFGHGWTEGSPPYPPHEEIYLQGIWVEASRAVAELADVMKDAALASAARTAAERARAAIEATYWLAGPRLLRLRHRPGQAGEGLQRRARPPPRRPPGPHRGPARPDAGGRGHGAAGGPALVARPGPRALAVRDRSPGLGGHRHRLGRAPHLVAQRAVRPAVVPLRLGVAALHGLGLGGGVPVRPPARRLPGLDGERAPDLPGRARLRHRAAVRGPQRALRPVLAPPGLVGGHGRLPAAARDAGDRGRGAAAGR